MTSLKSLIVSDENPLRYGCCLQWAMKDYLGPIPISNPHEVRLPHFLALPYVYSISLLSLRLTGITRVGILSSLTFIPLGLVSHSALVLSSDSRVQGVRSIHPVVASEKSVYNHLLYSIDEGT